MKYLGRLFLLLLILIIPPKILFLIIGVLAYTIWNS
jgi:hypothetical protein